MRGLKLGLATTPRSRTAATGPTVDQRVTESGARRVTEDGSRRILEQQSSLGIGDGMIGSTFVVG